MDINECLARALDRILSIQWDSDKDYRRTPSHMALIKEYLRRSGLWSLAVAPEWERPYFWFWDIGAKIDPAVRAPSDMVEKVERSLPFGTLHYITDTCVWSLHWIVLEATGATAHYGLPHPYEPILRIYERGGIFTWENRFIDFTRAAFRVANMAKYDLSVPITTLDDETLDRIDEEFWATSIHNPFKQESQR